VPEDNERRLESPAKATGRGKIYHVHEARIPKLEDMEDLCMAGAVIERIASGEEKVKSTEAFWCGLDDCVRSRRGNRWSGWPRWSAAASGRS
jgi:RHH-type rel operon transcriptional repressor/antitoxin RelB